MIHSQGRRAGLVLLCLQLILCLFSSAACGQFTTIINIPPDPNIGDSQSIGSDTQLNLANGGAIGEFFSAGAYSGTSNIEVNISGGTVGDDFGVRSGTIARVSGGLIGEGFHVTEGGVAKISGGSFGDYCGVADGGLVEISGGLFSANFIANEGSSVRLFGGEFRSSGMLISGLESIGDRRSIHRLFVLSGTLADGTPIILDNVVDMIDEDTLTLVAAALPPVGPALITAPSNPVPQGLRSGQTLRVNLGGAVGANFSAIEGSTVEVFGGQVGDNFEAVGVTSLKFLYQPL